MKRNYAFVQFRTVEEATRAKDATNGGKLDQSEITVEYVARRMGEGGRDRGRKCFSLLVWLFCSVFFHKVAPYTQYFYILFMIERP